MNKCKLNDIAVVLVGQSPKSEFYNTNGAGIPFLQGNRTFGRLYPYFDTYTTKTIKKALAGDILMSVRAPVGDLNIAPVDLCIGRGLCSIRRKNGDQMFLYYYLKNSMKQLRMMQNGTTFDSVNRDDIEQFELNIPDDATQVKISKVLTNIDEKVETNSQINAELESLAKTIYDYWFLQFDFPNKEGKPYKSSGGAMVWNEDLKMEIPEGWEVLNACDVAMIDTGDEDANHSTPNGKYPFFTCSNDILKCDDYAFDGKAVLIAGNGNFNVKSYEGKFNAYQRTYVVMPHDSSLYGTLYFSALYSVEKFKKGSNGSIVKYITKSDVDHIKVINPHNDVNIEILNNILSLIQHNQKENEELISLRDFLLPLLMNGQVEVA